MAATKIVDEAEIRRWIADGKTYAWMRDEYLRKYQVQVSFTMFSNFRYRKGLDRRIARDDKLIPWLVQIEHRHDYAVMQLRAEARMRAGMALTDPARTSLDAFKRGLVARDHVVAYEPAAGFTYVSRRHGIDIDLIRVPERTTTLRRSRD